MLGLQDWYRTCTNLSARRMRVVSLPTGDPLRFEPILPRTVIVAQGAVLRGREETEFLKRSVVLRD